MSQRRHCVACRGQGVRVVPVATMAVALAFPTLHGLDTGAQAPIRCATCRGSGVVLTDSRGKVVGHVSIRR